MLLKWMSVFFGVGWRGSSRQSCAFRPLALAVQEELDLRVLAHVKYID